MITILADVMTHLHTLQAIADRNGGTRASGTPGHEQSVDYIADRLRAAGFEVSTPAFEITYAETLTERLVVDGWQVPVTVMRSSPDTPDGGLSAPLAVLSGEAAHGREPADFADVAGKIVLVRRGGCTFARKQQNAAAAGAVGLLVYNTTDEWPLCSLGPDATGGIPSAGVWKAEGEALLEQAGAPVTLELRTWTEPRTSRNVIAQTTGSAGRVLMAGAHLDSVVEGPGINDAATGCAALLEIALRLGSAPATPNAVRFAFWGAEEFGQIGSQHYVDSLTKEQRAAIHAYLTFDMLGSTNGGHFVFDGAGESSGRPGPPGSARLQRTLADYLAARDVPTEPLSLIGGFDHMAFVAAGVPAGGLYTGATGIKTPAQAALWGGTAGVPYDPNYHQPGDRLDNVDERMLAHNLAAAAHAIGTHAQDVRPLNE